MEKKYLDWIKLNVPGTGYGECHNFALKMESEFKELTAVQGFYFCIVWGKRMHGWCIDESGNIIDPTANQFPSKGSGVYSEVKMDEAPSGKCLNCGILHYNDLDSNFCGDDCANSYASFCQNGSL